MKYLLPLLLVFGIACNNPNQRSRSGELVLPLPRVIDKGGIYSGTQKADSVNPAVLITTSEPVEIRNSNITGIGSQQAIKMYGYTTTYIHDNTINQIHGPDGNQMAKSVFNYKLRRFKFENNDVTGGSGLSIQDFDDTGLGDSIIVRFNRGKNMSKAKADGSDGGDHAQFIQLNTVRGFKYAEIAWNECINNPFESWVEDIVSVINSEGALIWIHDNFFKGNYPYAAAENNVQGVRNYTGSTITAETNGDGARANQLCKNILVENNTLLESGNAALNFTSTVNCHGRGNRIVTSGILPNGIKPNYFWSATWIGNGAGIQENLIMTNSIKGNYIMYAHLAGGNTYPYIGRQDERSLRGNTEWGMNRMPPGLNTYGPDRPVTSADIIAEHVLWDKKVSDSAKRIGNIQKEPVPVKPTPVEPEPVKPEPIPELSMYHGDLKKGSIAVLSATGNLGTYKIITYTSSNLVIFSITKNILKPTDFTVKGIAAGSATATVTLTNLAGVVITKTFTVKVLPLGDATSFNIIL